jgi:hypothetical protein
MPVSVQSLPTVFLPIPKNAPTIGECIYCGSRDGQLSKEHAIAYGLNGPWTLLKASCAACREITGAIEDDTLRGLLATVRTVCGMQSRRRKERPSALPLVLETAGLYRTIEVPVSYYPLYLPAPIFPTPGIVSGAPPVPFLPPQTIDFFHVAGPTFDAVAQQHGADFSGARLRFSPELFGRTLLKIGLCAAVYTVGVAPYRRSGVQRAILGTDPCIGHWVGSWTAGTMNENCGLHGIKVMSTGADVHVVIRLFAQFGAPEYHVALGPADPEFVKSSAWPFPR